MKTNQTNRFQVSAVELEARREEQSALTALFAIAGIAATGTAHALNTEPPPESEPSCTIFSW